MAFCRQCGKPIADDAIFCPHCDATAAIPTGPANSVIIPPPHTSQNRTPATPHYPAKAKIPFNIPCLAILTGCLLTWLFAPFMRVDFIHDYEFSFREAFEALLNYRNSLSFDGYGEVFREIPILFTAPIFIISIALGFLLTLLRKMDGLRVLCVINFLAITALFIIQALVKEHFIDYIKSLQLGFYCVYIGMAGLLFFTD